MILFPIPAPPGTPWWVGLLFVAAGLTTFAVLVWQAVRYFRDNPADDGRPGRDDHDGRGPSGPEAPSGH